MNNEIKELIELKEKYSNQLSEISSDLREMALSGHMAVEAGLGGDQTIASAHAWFIKRQIDKRDEETQKEIFFLIYGNSNFFKSLKIRKFDGSFVFTTNKPFMVLKEIRNKDMKLEEVIFDTSKKATVLKFWELKLFIDWVENMYADENLFQSTELIFDSQEEVYGI